MKIFITGCAKTGTTLVRRLFNAFDLRVHNSDELSLEDFMRSAHQVAKRTSESPFSDIIPVTTMGKLLRKAKNNGICIVNVVRAREEVLASSGGYVSEERYQYCMASARNPKLRKFIDHTIDYGKLLADPDGEQLRLADALGLTIVHKWSDYPSFINDETEDVPALDEYPLRPIGRK